MQSSSRVRFRLNAAGSGVSAAPHLTQAPSPIPGPLPGKDHGSADREVCISNISPRERTKRLIAGVIPFVLALGILAWQLSSGVDRLWRLPLFLLFVAAATGFFQWRDKT
jgi:hypothetical protein